MGAPETPSKDDDSPWTERAFEKLGQHIAKRPSVYIGVSLVVCIVASAGRSQLESVGDSENWVPTGAVALDHQDYVDENYPSELRYNGWIATCAGRRGRAL